MGFLPVVAPPAWVPPPVAAFSATPTSGDAPLTVDFSDLSSGSVDTHSWDFGDGGTSSVGDPTYRYDGAGDFNATLTVDGPGGSDSVSLLITVPEAAENLLLTCGLLLLAFLRRGAMSHNRSTGVGRMAPRSSR